MTFNSKKFVFISTITVTIATIIFYATILLLNRDEMLKQIYSFHHAGSWFLFFFGILIYPFTSKNKIKLFRYYLIHMPFLFFITSSAIVLLTTESKDIVVTENSLSKLDENISLQLNKFEVETIIRRNKPNYNYLVSIKEMNSNKIHLIKINHPLKLNNYYIYLKEWSGVLENLVYSIEDNQILNAQYGVFSIESEKNTIEIKPNAISLGGEIQYKYNINPQGTYGLFTANEVKLLPFSLKIYNEKMSYRVVLKIVTKPYFYLVIISSFIFICALTFTLFIRAEVKENDFN